MLDSVKIARRQSEIRQALAALVGKTDATADEIRNMETLDTEYRSNETRYRAALIAEDTERRDAGTELETRSSREWDELVAGFEMRQVALALDEGRALNGRTLEVITELRSKGGYRGMPVPWAALERRAGETVSGGTPNPVSTRPIIDRLFPDAVAARMGAQLIAIDSGAVEWPVTTSAITASWQATETGAVAAPAAFTTVDKALAPNNTLGVQMKITRKALLQSGAALEDAVRRDMNGAMAQGIDKAIFLGTGTGGQPLGIIPGATTYGITSTAFVNTGSMYKNFREAVMRFMLGNAANSPAAVRALVRPEVWNKMDDAYITGTAITEWDRLVAKLGAVEASSNALADPTGSPLASTAVLTTSAGGIAPAFVGAWGAVDLIRDPFSDASSGALRLTALATIDVTVARGGQVQLLTGIQ